MTPLQKAAFARMNGAKAPKKKGKPNFAKEEKEGSKAEEAYDRSHGEKDKNDQAGKDDGKLSNKGFNPANFKK